MISALPRDVAEERPLLLPFRIDDRGPQPDERITLRTYYDRWILPELSTLTKGSLTEDRIAIGHWERETGDPDIRELNDDEQARDCINRLEQGMLAKHKSAGTVNKTWREISMMFRFAVENDVLRKAPSPGYRRRSKLVKEAPKMQRETLDDEEVTRIWHACRAATYPEKGQFPAPLLWRRAIEIFYIYGPRTRDVFCRLGWENVRFRDRLILFEAMKTRKLQGLPLTDLVMNNLKTIKGLTELLFAFFKTPGCHRRRTDWRPGYYTTWRHEILPAAGFRPDEIKFKHFREAMVTRYNAIDGRLGTWIAGHYTPGVSAQNYDLPTRQIRQMIESAPVPNCFHQVD